jgi:hypothetical protein
MTLRCEGIRSVVRRVVDENVHRSKDFFRLVKEQRNYRRVAEIGWHDFHRSSESANGIDDFVRAFRDLGFVEFKTKTTGCGRPGRAGKIRSEDFCPFGSESFRRSRTDAERIVDSRNQRNLVLQSSMDHGSMLPWARKSADKAILLIRARIISLDLAAFKYILDAELR